MSDWREYLKAIAAGANAAFLSAIATSAAVQSMESGPLKIALIVGAAVVGGLSGGVVVYAIPNKPPATATAAKGDAPRA